MVYRTTGKEGNAGNSKGFPAFLSELSISNWRVVTVSPDKFSGNQPFQISSAMSLRYFLAHGIPNILNGYFLSSIQLTINGIGMRSPNQQRGIGLFVNTPLFMLAGLARPLQSIGGCRSAVKIPYGFRGFARWTNFVCNHNKFKILCLLGHPTH